MPTFVEAVQREETHKIALQSMQGDSFTLDELPDVDVDDVLINPDYYYG